MKLTNLDLKILANLNQDGRLAESQIGKKVRASKQVVKYRMNKLEKEGIIDGYYTMLNVGQMGFDSYYIFLQLSGLNSEQEKQLYNKILKLSYIAWLVTGVGRWDAVLLFCAKDIMQFNEQLSELKRIVGKHLHEYTYTNLVQAKHVNYKFLDSKQSNILETTSKNNEIKLDRLDKNILRTINQEGRMQVTEIAEKIKETTYNVHYRLKKLKEMKIIKGFRPKLNISKLGLQWHLLLIKFNSVSNSRIKAFIDYCEKNNSVYYVTNSVGNYDIMLDLHVKTSEDFRKFLFDIKNEFQDVILLYESMVIFDELLITYIPEIILS